MDIKIKKLVGQKLVGGFPGKEMSPEFIELVKEYKVSNVILFTRNVESRKQLRSLCQSIQELVKEETGYGAFITIDQEGGVVTRLPEDSVNVPGAMALAATGSPESARLAAEITAGELRALGINFNLAPVLDINNNAANPVIGVRSFGDTAEKVVEYGGAAIEGYLSGGVLAAAKHFPGHGDTSVDSHIGLPVIDKSLEELSRLELKPFQSVVQKGIPAVMSSHILFPQLEPEKVPCTMSRKIITGLLKEKLGFQGLVISDCLEMDAIRKYYGITRGAVQAAGAGIDLILISHTASFVREAALAIYQELEEGRLSMEELEESAAKIIRWKEQFVQSMFPAEDCQNAEAEAISTRLRYQSIVLTQGMVLPVNDRVLFTGCGDYRASRVSNEESGVITFPEYMRKRFGGTGIITGKDPDKAEISRVAGEADIADAIILCTSNAHIMAGQMELLMTLAQLGKPMMVVALRNPYDLAGLPDHVTGIAAWDYSVMTLAVLADLFAGKFRPAGIMPVSLQTD